MIALLQGLFSSRLSYLFFVIGVRTYENRSGGKHGRLINAGYMCVCVYIMDGIKKSISRE